VRLNTGSNDSNEKLERLEMPEIAIAPMSSKATFHNSKQQDLLLVQPTTKQSGLLSSDLDHLFAEQERIYRAKNVQDPKSNKKRKKNQRVSLMELEPMKGMAIDKNVAVLDRNNDLLLKQIKYKEEMNEERKNMV